MGQWVKRSRVLVFRTCVKPGVVDAVTAALLSGGRQESPWKPCQLAHAAQQQEDPPSVKGEGDTGGFLTSTRVLQSVHAHAHAHTVRPPWLHGESAASLRLEKGVKVERSDRHRGEGRQKRIG